MPISTSSRFSVLAMVLSLVASIGLAGCNDHQDERIGLQRELQGLMDDLSQHQALLQQANANVQTLQAQITFIGAQVQTDASHVKESQDSLAAYALEHKLAVLAVAATGAGIASTVSDNLSDDDKKTLEAAGTVGALYCLFGANDGECADALVKITYFGSQIAYYKNQSQQHSAVLQQYQSELAGYEQARAPILTQIAMVNQSIELTNHQLEKLTCTLCI